MDNSKIISNQNAADLLTKTESKQLLEPFIKSEVSLSMAAKKLNMKLNTLHYHVQKMLELDLLEISREEVQNGRAVKLYRTTSQSFLVPLEATSSVDLATHAEDLFATSHKIMASGISKAMLGQASQWAFHVFFIPDMGMVQEIVAKNSEGLYQSPNNLPQPYIYYASDGEVNLSKEDALELQESLDEVYQRFLTKRKKQNEGQAYWLQLGLAPIHQS